jgi:outer membrane protein TolC
MKLVLIVALIPLFLASASAADRLNLDDCIQRGVEENLLLQMQRLQLAAASADVVRVSAMYDPRLQIDGTWQDSELPPGSFPSQGGLERGQATARLLRGFSSGTTVGFEVDAQRNLFEGMAPSDEPTFRTAAGITLRQSLWRNAFGSGQRAQVDYVRQRLLALELDYARARDEVAAAIADDYWQALTAQVTADTRAATIERLGKLLENNRRLVADGLLNESAVLAVEASLAVVEVEVERLRHEAIGLDERLKERVNLPFEDWDRVRIDYHWPSSLSVPLEANFTEVFETSMQQRADVEALRREEQRVESLIRWREQDDRGDIEIAGSFGRGGSDSDFGETLDFDKNVWSVGVMIDLSLGRSASRADLMQALLERERIRTEMTMLERSIQLACRNAVRSFSTAQRLVAAAEKARDAQQRKLDLEVERFQRGQSDTKTLIDYENDLEEAERQHAQARGALERARMALRLVQGEVLAAP